METVKHFYHNYKLYRIGTLEHEEISSLTIKKIM